MLHSDKVTKSSYILIGGATTLSVIAASLWAIISKSLASCNVVTMLSSILFIAFVFGIINGIVYYST
jgi:hypothetical protein